MIYDGGSLDITQVYICVCICMYRFFYYILMYDSYFNSSPDACRFEHVIVSFEQKPSKPEITTRFPPAAASLLVSSPPATPGSGDSATNHMTHTHSSPSLPSLVGPPQTRGSS